MLIYIMFNYIINTVLLIMISNKQVINSIQLIVVIEKSQEKIVGVILYWKKLFP